MGMNIHMASEEIDAWDAWDARMDAIELSLINISKSLAVLQQRQKDPQSPLMESASHSIPTLQSVDLPSFDEDGPLGWKSCVEANFFVLGETESSNGSSADKRLKCSADRTDFWAMESFHQDKLMKSSQQMKLLGWILELPNVGMESELDQVVEHEWEWEYLVSLVPPKLSDRKLHEAPMENQAACCSDTPPPPPKPPDDDLLVAARGTRMNKMAAALQPQNNSTAVYGRARTLICGGLIRPPPPPEPLKSPPSDSLEPRVPRPCLAAAKTIVKLRREVLPPHKVSVQMEKRVCLEGKLSHFSNLMGQAQHTKGISLDLESGEVYYLRSRKHYSENMRVGIGPNLTCTRPNSLIVETYDEPKAITETKLQWQSKKGGRRRSFERCIGAEILGKSCTRFDFRSNTGNLLPPSRVYDPNLIFWLLPKLEHMVELSHPSWNYNSCQKEEENNIHNLFYSFCLEDKADFQAGGIDSDFAIKCGGPQITSTDGTGYEMDKETPVPATYFVIDTNRVSGDINSRLRRPTPMFQGGLQGMNNSDGVLPRDVNGNNLIQFDKGLLIKSFQPIPTEALFIQNHFPMEEKIAKLQYLGSSVSDLRWDEGFKFGVVTERRVENVKDVGIVISLEKYSDVFGFITNYQFGGTVLEKGSVVEALFLDVAKAKITEIKAFGLKLKFGFDLHDGSHTAEPNEVELACRESNRHGRTMIEWLIPWKAQTAAKATWKEANLIMQQHPSLGLEDKATTTGSGIDRNLVPITLGQQTFKGKPAEATMPPEVEVEGVDSAVPGATLASKESKHNGLTVIEWLILGKAQTAEETTWKEAESFKDRFPSLCLEDKTGFTEGGIVRNPVQPSKFPTWSSPIQINLERFILEGSSSSSTSSREPVK